MNGDALITRVRRLLRDVPSDTEQGEFWHDREIILALNAAQDILVNMSMRRSLALYAANLFTTSGFRSPGALPADYVHYASATVGDDAASQRIARVYLGAEGDAYRYANSDGAFIFGTDVYFVREGQASSGVLYYYRRPSYIGATSLGDNARADFVTQDFDYWIYRDVIANDAMVILAMKEVQTQRDFKKQTRYLQNIILNPGREINLLDNKEHKVYEKSNGQ